MKEDLPKSKIQISNLFTLIKKELNTLFNSPTAYIILIVFVAIKLFLFFLNFFAMQSSQFDAYFNFLPWIMMIVIPAVTMGDIASEKKDGTIEYILTNPVGIFEYVLSKVISSSFFITLAFIITLPLMVYISTFGDFDWGRIVAQYLSTIFLTISLTSVGVFISSLVNSQVAAFLISTLTNFFLILMGSEAITRFFPSDMIKYITKMGIQTHTNSMNRGVIDIRDILYFTGFIAIFIILTFYKLQSEKFPKKSKGLLKLRVVTIVIIIATIFLAAFGQKLPFSVWTDLTKNKIYTLSEGSKTLVRNLEEPIELDIYVSQVLPPQFVPMKTDMIDLLKLYKSANDSKIKITYKFTDNSSVAQEAQEKGITPIQFHEQTEGRFQIQEGYLGLNVKYGDTEEAIPNVIETNNLEYQLSSLINKIANDDKPTVAILSSNVKQSAAPSLGGMFGGSPDASISEFKKELENQFIVETFILEAPQEEQKDENGEVTQEATEGQTKISDEYDVVIIPGPNAEMQEVLTNEIHRYFQDGGSIFMMVDTVDVNMRTFEGTKNEFSMKDMFSGHGFEVKESLLYDMRSHNIVSIGYGLVNYPFWMNVPTVQGHSITDRISTVMIPWGNYIKIDEEKLDGWEYTELLRTTEFAGYQDTVFNIDPKQQWNMNSGSLDSYPIAVALNETDDKPGRAVLVANSGFISDTYSANNQNKTFALSAVEWLAQNELLAGIRAKSRTAAPLSFTAEWQPLVIQYGGTGAIVGAILAFGIAKYVLRRKEMNKVYEG